MGSEKGSNTSMGMSGIDDVGSSADSFLSNGGKAKGDGEGFANTSIGRGQTIKQAYAHDSSAYDVPRTRGGKLGGSLTNLGHSLSGTSVPKGKSGPSSHDM